MVTRKKRSVCPNIATWVTAILVVSKEKHHDRMTRVSARQTQHSFGLMISMILQKIMTCLIKNQNVLGPLLRGGEKNPPYFLTIQFFIPNMGEISPEILHFCPSRRRSKVGKITDGGWNSTSCLGGW